MLQRIKVILDFKGLSVTQFADEVGVPRPIMSHILSGRNKPSLEVVQKVLKGFPELSVPWLVLGEGQMLKKQEMPVATGAGKPEKKPAEADAVPNLEKEHYQEKSQKKEIAEKPVPPSAGIKSGAEKIIVLYGDNTFREFDRQP